MLDVEQLEALQEYLNKEFDTTEPTVIPQQQLHDEHSNPMVITVPTVTAHDNLNDDVDHIDDRPYFLTIMKMMSDDLFSI